MRKIILFLVFSILIFCIVPIVGADDNDLLGMDGNTWNRWNLLQKLYFLSGFITGTGYVVSYNLQTVEPYDKDKMLNLFRAYKFPDTNNPKDTFSRQEVTNLLAFTKDTFNSPLYRYSIIKINNDQISDGLDSFYKDFKNRMIKLADAIYVVRKQIRGGSSEEIEAVMQFLRADKDVNKLFYKDKDGNMQYVPFP
jgi:hypothetical protein